MKRAYGSRTRVGFMTQARSRVARIALPEKKFADVLDPATSTTVNVAHLNPVAGLLGSCGITSFPAIKQGAGVTERVGSKVYIESLIAKVRLTAYYSTDVTELGHSPDVFFRVVVFIDKQPNKTVLTTSTAGPLLFAPMVSGTSATANAITQANRNLEYSSRFSILYDREHKLSRDAVIDSSEEAEKHVSIYKKFRKPLKVVYESGTTSGLPGTIIDNSMYVAVWLCSGNNTEDPSGANPGHFGQADVTMRLRYTDQ